MMRRGFTLLETMLASTISVFVFAAILGLILSVWMLTKGSSDQLQGALRARYVRERFFYDAMRVGDKSYGLISATNVIVTANEVIAQFKDGKKFPSDAPNSNDLLGFLDKTGSHEYRSRGASLQYVYLAVKVGKATYYDRMVVPVFGRYTQDVNDMAEIMEAFGGSH